MKGRSNVVGGCGVASLPRLQGSVLLLNSGSHALTPTDDNLRVADQPSAIAEKSSAPH